jgi:hypothetical protein
MDNHVSEVAPGQTRSVEPPPPPLDRGGALVAKLKGQYHQPNTGLVIHMLQELLYLVNTWQKEILDLEERIALVKQAGPVVAGWLEAEPVSGTGSEIVAQDDSITSSNAADALPATLLQQNLDYQLCSLDENGEIAARDCPEPEMFGISKALARHRQLRQLLDRKSDLEANIKHTLATLVHLRMEIN